MILPRDLNTMKRLTTSNPVLGKNNKQMYGEDLQTMASVTDKSHLYLGGSSQK